MKIAIIGQKGIPATFGGVEFHVDRLSTGLVKQGHEVIAYVRSWYTDRNLKSYKGVKLIHIPTIKTKHLDASIHSFLCSFHAIFSGSDIIHYHCLGPSFFSFIPRLFGKKVVTTIHRLDWATEKWGKIARFFLKISEFIASNVPNRTIVVSRDLQEYIKNKYQVKATHISHGIEIPKKISAKIIKKKYQLGGKDYILFMGRLTPEKRVDWLIQSFKKIQNNSEVAKTLKLVISGGSSATDNYIIKIKKLSDADPKIIYTGYVTGNEKEELLSNALIFILPSHLEGYPIVLLEAKSYGNCCLISDIPPHREEIEDGKNGLLFNADDINDFIKKMQALIHDPKKAEKIGEIAEKEMRKKPGWELVSYQTAKVYTEILKKGHNPRGLKSNK